MLQQAEQGGNHDLTSIMMGMHTLLQQQQQAPDCAYAAWQGALPILLQPRCCVIDYSTLQLCQYSSCGHNIMLLPCSMQLAALLYDAVCLKLHSKASNIYLQVYHALPHQHAHLPSTQPSV